VLYCFSGTTDDVILLSSFAKYKNINTSKTKDIPKRKTPFYFILKSLSNNQQLF